MLRVEDIAAEIIAREGGYVNDPYDPGGATKFGVTIHTMRALGLDLDDSGDVDAADVRLLTRAAATEILFSTISNAHGLPSSPKAFSQACSTCMSMRVPMQCASSSGSWAKWARRSPWTVFWAHKASLLRRPPFAPRRKK